jgi:hypothetical protein
MALMRVGTRRLLHFKCRRKTPVPSLRGQSLGEFRLQLLEDARGTDCPRQRSWGANRWCSWVDAGGNFWLFGGFAYAGTLTVGFLNDLWKYSTD